MKRPKRAGRIGENFGRDIVILVKLSTIGMEIDE